jgi:Flp pilus assembly protein TadD
MNTKPSKEQIINQAFQFHLKGNISEATKFYQYCINQGFKDHRVFSNYGVILQNLGKLQEAESSTRKAIEIKPDFAEAHYNLGNILKSLGKLQEAESSTRKAIEIKPNYAEAYLNLGSILKGLGKLQDAELSTRKAIEIKPDFAEAYSNLGKILTDLGNLQDAELSYRKAIELNPNNQSINNNLINLLTIYKPNMLSSNRFHTINEEFKRINLNKINNEIITDNKAIQIYRNGLRIYRKYDLDIETHFSQIFKRNKSNLNCKRHMMIFEQHKIIPEFCFGCYKVQVEVDSIIELIKLFLVFNTLKLKHNNTRKCMIEMRPYVPGFYKGLIYCLGLEEALEISKQVNIQIQNYIKINLTSKVKRGCSEYALEFPKYKEIRTSRDQTMKYDQNWKIIEREFDNSNQNWGVSHENLEGFNLNDFLVMRNWIAYAKKIGDQSVTQVTNEQIKIPKEYNDLKRVFYSDHTSNRII